ncbi:terminase [Streptomyces sp. NBC_00996]|uniref:terminase n=1 Tax=Streptomyces sp. NBC_00996 TaxID=2903710 RepID=UPI00386D12D0|nr:terminase [Streptomyces sp. NBC_00996]
MTVSVLVDPAYRSQPQWRSTLGPEVADLARLAGFGPDPEQEMILDALFALDERGTSACFEVATVVGRQNLKTGLMKQAALGWLFLTEERLVIWSAHNFLAAEEAFRDLEILITGCASLSRQVKHIHRGNGDEAIELYGDRRLLFKTRTKGGGRSLSGDKVILDEAFALQPMHMGAMLPTLSARPDPQVLYGSSAGLAESAVLRGIRDRGRAGKDARLAYFEWCAPPQEQVCAAGAKCTHALGTEGCGCDKPELWQIANPQLGRRISIDFMAAERRALPPSEFAREHMGWWDEPVGGLIPITVEAWAACADEESQVQDPVAIAVDVTPDRSMAAIAVAGRRADGLMHGELVEHRTGTGWLMDRLVELASRWRPCAVVLNPAGPAGSLEKEMNERGFKTEPVGGEWRLHLVGSREYAQACGALTDDVNNGRWAHADQAPLNKAVEGAGTRPLAEAWAWSHRNSLNDISPLTAITLARHGFAAHGVTEPVAPFAIWS